ncbi:unnamed protein product [Linum tenue]|uniref:Uncharacterized protein n=1 Tax=Linum tenue TaxID=586396 RepID=A0AAV0GM91_9ROSI|nr:unnamed protein product [Linum tenue]
MRTAYDLTRDDGDEAQHNPTWKAVWRIPGPQRTKTLFWLVLHDRLLTNAERLRRHLANSDQCTICGGGPKTFIHVMRDCAYARDVWSHFLADEPDRVLFQTDIPRWGFHYLMDQSPVVDASTFALVCWQLWQNRNTWVFEKRLVAPMQLAGRIKQLCSQVSLAFKASQSVTGCESKRSTQLISWKRPPSGWASLNTDGSVLLSQNKAAAGGVIRREDGRMLRAFSVNLGGGSITHAELAGIDQGMRLAWEMGIRKLAVQTDSATAISLIQEDPSSHPHRMLVKSIRRSLSLEWEIP